MSNISRPCDHSGPGYLYSNFLSSTIEGHYKDADILLLPQTTSDPDSCHKNASIINFIWTKNHVVLVDKFSKGSRICRRVGFHHIDEHISQQGWDIDKHSLIEDTFCRWRMDYKKRAEEIRKLAAEEEWQKFLEKEGVLDECSSLALCDTTSIIFKIRLAIEEERFGTANQLLVKFLKRIDQYQELEWDLYFRQTFQDRVDSLLQAITDVPKKKKVIVLGDQNFFTPQDEIALHTNRVFELIMKKKFTLQSSKIIPFKDPHIVVYKSNNSTFLSTPIKMTFEEISKEYERLEKRALASQKPKSNNFLMRRRKNKGAREKSEIHYDTPPRVLLPPQCVTFTSLCDSERSSGESSIDSSSTRSTPASSASSTPTSTPPPSPPSSPVLRTRTIRTQRKEPLPPIDLLDNKRFAKIKTLPSTGKAEDCLVQ